MTTSQGTRRRVFSIAVTASLALSLSWGEPVGAATASRGSVACLDSSSPSYAVDRQVVAALGKYGDPLTQFVFDGGQGVSERFFQYLSRTKCTVIMGFPIDVISPDPPDGLALTSPYLDTAYVLVARRKLSQAQLKPGMTISVGMGTAPHFYLAGALGSVPNYTTNTFQTQDQVLDALGRHQADVAMAWEPSVVHYRAAHPAARTWSMSRLAIRHAHWKIGALYPENNQSAADRFNAALARLIGSGGLEPIVKPYSLENVSP